ncbi:MAG TPA: hypothetical protein VMH85_08455 [Terriglobales bacterium]|nr:hypothetical protein [Terriglobales bacterium]
METNPQPEPSRPLKGALGLIIAVAVVAILLVALPPYRVFFFISFGIGILVAGGLYLWHRLRPVKEADVDHKKPLGLE